MRYWECARATIRRRLCAASRCDAGSNDKDLNWASVPSPWSSSQSPSSSFASAASTSVCIAWINSAQGVGAVGGGGSGGGGGVGGGGGGGLSSSVLVAGPSSSEWRGLNDSASGARFGPSSRRTGVGGARRPFRFSAGGGEGAPTSESPRTFRPRNQRRDRGEATFAACGSALNRSTGDSVPDSRETITSTPWRATSAARSQLERAAVGMVTLAKRARRARKRASLVGCATTTPSRKFPT